MGQKINPKAIRIANVGFLNNWYSDYKFSSFFYQDLSIKKTQIRMLLKYYKTRVRFLKGRRRRLKSILRMTSFYCLRLPYKTILLSCFLRPAIMGLQNKHTAFIFKRPNRLPLLLNRGGRSPINKLRNNGIPSLWGSQYSLKSRGYLKRLKKLATLL
uniref:Uncharacterized protein n=1 Tax=Bulbochaete rectangularis var. hiloensis TaxID=55990 RepID=A0A6M4SRI2_9CHLO|nr:hypothetical protein [Bulbochaete rectangularis var. hiloensis]